MKEQVKTKLKKVKGWKTISFNGLTALLSLAAWPEIHQYVDSQTLMLGVAGANIALRYVTTSPVGLKEVG